MKRKFHLTFVCPRYLKNHAGGAEVHCLQVAGQLAKAGHIVELLATTTTNHYTWENEFAEKVFEENGITVRLFSINQRPLLERFHEIERKIAEGESLSEEEENDWIANSVNSDNMYKYIQESGADYFIFIPYLFGLTLNGAKIHPEKTLLISCLHDEPFAYLSCMRELFLGVKRVLFNAPPEKELAQRLYGVDEEKCRLVSLGFESQGEADPERIRKKYKIKGPYITYAGRREDGKNFFLLLEMIRLFQKIYPERVSFVTMGTPPVSLNSSDQGKIVDLGFVCEQDKRDCFAGALINCQPSTNESLSITIMESWLCGVPVMVHNRCNVTSYWVNLCQGGFAFRDYFEFEQMLMYALEHPDILREMGQNGKYFVEENFNWDVISTRFMEALD